MMNIELTTNNKIEFLKEMIKELELKQTEVLKTKMIKAEQPSMFEFTDNKHIETTYGPQWLLVQKVWGDTKRDKICFSLTPSWSDNTLVKVIKMKEYKFIAQNMVKRLFNKDYTQFTKLLATLDDGLTGKFVFTEVNQGKTPGYAYSVGDFQAVSDVLNDQPWDERDEH